MDHDDIPMQRIACHEFAQQQGDWEIVNELYEKGVSGYKVSTDKRDAISQLKVDALAGKFDVLLVFMFDRLGRRDDETPFVVQWFVAHAFFQKLHIERPVFVGASDGGMVAQIYVKKYPGETGALVLISTGGMDAATLKALRRKYRLAPVMLWYMKRCNYEKLKPRLIKAGMSHIRNESPEEIAYVQDMFETIFKDYKQEKDVHISTLPVPSSRYERVGCPSSFFTRATGVKVEQRSSTNVGLGIVMRTKQDDEICYSLARFLKYII